MENREFNLLDERWIRVRYPDCREEEVSLRQVFAHAHEYAGLAGELPTQDMAMLRLLLAVLHAVFYRVDESGSPAPIEESDDAYERWENLWKLKRFPQQPIEDYLEQWRERFWLFHPEYPFYQVPEAKIGTEYAASKLNGEISESSNKKRLFPARTGKPKSELSYAEAARWLLYVNAFDDTSAKPKGKNLPSVGAGWLGKLGLIAAKGDNLFETLMLNFVLLDENGEPWAPPRPVWELEVPRSAERTKIPWPNNQAELLTLQSRRLLLCRSEDKVTGYYLLGGDFFDKENASVEQMTVWKPVYSSKREVIGYQPARHAAERKMWQDFGSMFVNPTGREENRKQFPLPGVVRWIGALTDPENEVDLDKGKKITYQIASVQYGDKDFFAADTFEDSLSFHLNLLTELGEAWTNSITSAVRLCDDVANQVGQLAKNLVLAAGGSDSDADGDVQRAKEQFYYRVDMPFRAWLQTLDASQSDTVREERMKDWTEQALEIAGRLGQDLIAQAGPAAYHGRTITKNNKDTFFAAPEVYRWFKNALYKYKDKGDQQ